jgi:hypothetical protein
MRIRAKLLFDPDRGWHVDLPTYAMIPNTWLPKIAGGVPIPAHTNTQTGAPVPAGVADLCDGNGIHHRAAPNDARLANLSCEVEVPDNYIDPDTGAIDPNRIRQIHKTHPRWADPDQPPNV